MTDLTSISDEYPKSPERMSVILVVSPDAFVPAVSIPIAVSCGHLTTREPLILI